MFIFDVEWFKDVLDKVPQGSITVDGSSFTMIDSMRIYSASEGTFILPSHCEQVTTRL
jgi:riboflavin synthase alpha subunit